MVKFRYFTSLFLAAALVILPAFALPWNAEAVAIAHAKSELVAAGAMTRSLAPLVERTAVATAAARSHVLTSSDLDRAAIDVGKARVILANLRDETDEKAGSIRQAELAGPVWPWQAEANSELLARDSLSLRIADAGRSIEALSADNTSTAASVSEWNLEQARIAAELDAAQAAAAAAEGAAAAEAAAAAAAAKVLPAPHSAHQKSTAAVATRSSTFTIYVRASIDAGYADTSTPGGLYNGQDQINRGGQVAINWPRWGTFVSAHNTNDSSALRMNSGDTVTLSGAITGTFRVIGAVVIRNGDGPDQALRLPTRLFMQTCFFGTGTMRLVGLAPA